MAEFVSRPLLMDVRRGHVQTYWASNTVHQTGSTENLKAIAPSKLILGTCLRLQRHLGHQLEVARQVCVLRISI